MVSRHLHLGDRDRHVDQWPAVHPARGGAVSNESAVASLSENHALHNQYLLSVLLGIIEGITEFLPISSTAHLRIAERLFDISLQDDFWKMYTIVIQLGAIAALPVYFWRRILKFISTFPKGERG